MVDPTFAKKQLDLLTREWYMKPDGQIPALSDSDSGSYLDLLLLAGESLDADDLRYVATQGRQGTAPAERCVGFPVGGYFVQRSGWGETGTPFSDERFLLRVRGRRSADA